jgi:anti-sigma-K factor RskA
MKCDDVRTILEETRDRNAPEAALTHLASCALCAEWWQEWQMMTEGFRLLSADAGPEPSWGFSERVLRRLQETAEAARGGADLIERAGRRVVWATLALTLTAVLALVVPSSGPVRAASEPDSLVVQTQASSSDSYPIVEVDNTDNSAAQTVTPPAARENK